MMTIVEMLLINKMKAWKVIVAIVFCMIYLFDNSVISRCSLRIFDSLVKVLIYFILVRFS